MTELTVVGKLQSLPKIAQYIQQLAREVGLDAHTSYNLRLAVDEISTNIILHGYCQTEEPGLLVFSTILTSEQLIVILEDTGSAYDPEQLHQLSADQIDKTLEQRPMGGLGVYLAVRSVDEFHYERIGDRNRTRFVINR